MSGTGMALKMLQSRGDDSTNVATVHAIRAALESAGIEFIG